MPEKKVDIEKIKAVLPKIKAALVTIRKIYKKSDDKIDEHEQEILDAIVANIKAIEKKIKEDEEKENKEAEEKKIKEDEEKGNKEAEEKKIKEAEEKGNSSFITPKLKVTKPFVGGGSTFFGVSVDENGVGAFAKKNFDLGSKEWKTPNLIPNPFLDIGLLAQLSANIEVVGDVGISKGVGFLNCTMSTKAGGLIGCYATDKLHLVRIVGGVKLELDKTQKLSFNTKDIVAFTPIDFNIKASVVFSIEEGDFIKAWNENEYIPEELKIPFPNVEFTLSEVEVVYFRVNLSIENIKKSTITEYGVSKEAKKVINQIGDACDSIKKKYDEMVAGIVDFLDSEELENAIVSFWESIGGDYITDKWDQLTDSKYTRKKEMYKEACEASVKEAMRKDPKLAMEYAMKTKAQKQKYFEEVISTIPLVKKLHRELFDEDIEDEVSEQAINTANAIAAKYSITISGNSQKIAIGEKCEFQITYKSDREFQAEDIDVNLMCMGIPVSGLSFDPEPKNDTDDAWIDKGEFTETCTTVITQDLIDKVLTKNKCDIEDIFFTAKVSVVLAGNPKDIVQQIPISITKPLSVDEQKK